MSFFLELQKNKNSTPIEKEIINFIINYPNQVIEMTMEDLAKSTYTSRSTIARFCKKQGYDGFNNLKMQLAIELNLFLKGEETTLSSLPFEKGDESSEIVDKIISQSTFSISETIRSNPIEKIENLANKILAADHVVFLGVQFSGVVAYDAHLKFSRIGLHSKYFIVESDILTYSYFASPNDVVFILSYSGETSVILEAAKHIKNRGSYMVSITKNYKNSLLDYCNLNMYINSIDDPNNNLSLSSRIATLGLIDVIYGILFNEQNENFYDRLMKINKLYKKDFGNY